MQTVAQSPTCRHTTIHIDTERPTQFIDLTPNLEEFVAASGIQSGLLNVQSLHTTAAIVVNEHEPLLLGDMAGLLERLVPVDDIYRHDNITLRTVNCVLGEPPNGHSHCRALLLGSTAALNIVDGKIQLGRWQRVFLVELDGPRTRDVSLLLLGDPPSRPPRFGEAGPPSRPGRFGEAGPPSRPPRFGEAGGR